jgi:hypothetical protein
VLAHLPQTYRAIRTQGLLLLEQSATELAYDQPLLSSATSHQHRVVPEAGASRHFVRGRPDRYREGPASLPMVVAKRP